MDGNYTPYPMTDANSDSWAYYNTGKTFTYVNWGRYYTGENKNYSAYDCLVLAGNNSYYTQLYVPYDYFKRACKMIQSVYSESNQYAGYHNFMHYWATNGDWNWINFTTESNEFDNNEKDLVQVNYTYLSANFWNNFDPNDDDQDHAYAACTDPINW